MFRTPACGDKLPLHGVCGDLLHQLDLDIRRPAAGREVRLEAARELLFIAAHRKAQSHANVTLVTLQLCEFDRLGAA